MRRDEARRARDDRNRRRCRVSFFDTFFDSRRSHSCALAAVDLRGAQKWHRALFPRSAIRPRVTRLIELAALGFLLFSVLLCRVGRLSFTRARDPWDPSDRRNFAALDKAARSLLHARQCSLPSSPSVLPPPGGTRDDKSKKERRQFWLKLFLTQSIPHPRLVSLFSFPLCRLAHQFRTLTMKLRYLLINGRK